MFQSLLDPFIYLPVTEVRSLFENNKKIRDYYSRLHLKVIEKIYHLIESILIKSNIFLCSNRNVYMKMYTIK